MMPIDQYLFIWCFLLLSPGLHRGSFSLVSLLMSKGTQLVSGFLDCEQLGVVCELLPLFFSPYFLSFLFFPNLVTFSVHRYINRIRHIHTHKFKKYLEYLLTGLVREIM